MSDVAVQRFSCDGCGKRYPWKAELSNKRVKCKCGAVMTVPDLSAPVDDDGPPALPTDDIFDVVEQQREISPPRYQQMEADAAARVVAKPAAAKPQGRSAAALQVPGRSAPLGYQSGRGTPRQRERESAMHDMTRDVYAPLGLIAGAFLCYFAWLLFNGKGGASIAVYGTGMVVLFAIKTVLMVLGAFVVASMASVSFGPMGTAILKLAAVAVAPDILATIIEEAIGIGAMGGILAGSIALGFYWVLVAWLFGMDPEEAWTVVVYFAVLRWFLTFILSMLVLGWFVSGGGLGALGGGGSGVPKSAAAAQVQVDEKIDELKEINRLEEARAYIDRTRRESNMSGVTDELYDAGAKKVYFAVDRDINGKAEPYAVVVEWPRDAKKREAVLAIINKYFKRSLMGTEPDEDIIDTDPDTDEPDAPATTQPARKPITDDGGKYIMLPRL